MADIYQLSVEIDSTDVNRANKDLDNFANTEVKTKADTDNLTKSVKKQNTQLKQMGATTDSADKSVKKLNTSVNKTSKGLSNVRGVAQSAGYQLQDVAVQAQMGTNAFTILGQQGSQFASSFGPTGAVVGAVLAIGAAVGGVLVKALGNAAMTAEELSDRIGELDRDFASLTDAQRRFLSKQETSLIAEKQAEIVKLETSIEDLQGVYERSELAFESIAKRGEFTEAYISMNKEMIAQEEELNKLYAQRDTANQEIKKSQDQINQINNYNTIERSKQDVAALERLIESLRLKRVASEEGKEASILDRAATLGATGAVLEGIEADLMAIKAIEDKAEAKAKLAKETARIAREEAAAESLRASAVSRGLGGLGGGETILQKEAKRLDALRLATAEELEILGGRANAEILIEQEKMAALKVIKDKALEEDRQRNLTMFNSQVGLLSAITAYSLQEAQRKSQGDDEAARSAFETAKDLQKRIAIMGAGAAIINSLADPTLFGPAKWADMLSVGVTTAAQIKGIESQQWGGGSSSTPTPAAPPVTNNTTTNQNTFNFSGAINEQNVIPVIQGFFNDGGMAINPDTEQAAALR